LCLPALIHACWRMKSWKAFGAVVLGWTPFALWELFSLVYYGFLLPNTAYAKLLHGLGQARLLQNSAYYFSNSIQQDPITLCVIALGLIYACFVNDFSRRMIALGVVLYLLYLVKIGGDFMSGRLLTLPFLGSLIVLSNLSFQFKSWKFAVSLVLFILLGFAAPHPILLSGSEYGLTEARRDPHDIADERAEYYPKTGMLKFIGQRFAAGWIKRYIKGTQANEGDVITQGNMGFMGYYGGPEIHFIDVFGLTDPLLARLPARQDCFQRPGHYFRVMPVGYVETIRNQQLLIRDENLREYYQKLSVITQGPLFSFERFKTILLMNLGYYQHLIDREHYMSKPKSVFTLEELSVRVPDGAGWGHEDAHIFTSGWMTIQLG
ncbi:hypothetical protein K8I31_20405, partial [bacterium]|nr:hypothetical protein [bacterium]